MRWTNILAKCKKVCFWVHIRHPALGWEEPEIEEVKASVGSRNQPCSRVKAEK